MSDITDIVGKMPYRLALAGGRIDQPFVSQHNPSAPGAMVVVSVVPQFRFMDRAGICGSTRGMALELWNGVLPDTDRRLYMLEAIRYVHRVTLVTEAIEPDAIPKSIKIQPQVWAVDAKSSSPAKKAYCRAGGWQYKILAEKDLRGFGDYRFSSPAKTSQRKKVVVAGCFDWFHSGHGWMDAEPEILRGF